MNPFNPWHPCSILRHLSQQFFAHFAVAGDGHWAALGVGDGGVGVDAQEVKCRREDVLRRDRKILDFAGVLIGGADDLAARAPPPAMTIE